MATAKKGSKSNKTAHVLNLLTEPGGVKDPAAEPAQEEAASSAAPISEETPESVGRPLTPPVLEVARSNDALLSMQIKDALESELLAEAGGAVPAPEALADPVNEPAQDAEPEPEPVQHAKPASGGGSLSQEEIERMLAGGIPEPQPPQAAEPEPEPVQPTKPASGGGSLSQEEIERMLAGGIPEPQPPQAAEPEPEPVQHTKPASGGGSLSQEEIERMLAGGIPEPQPPQAAEPEPEPVQHAKPDKPPAAPQPDPDELMVINVMETLVEQKAPRYISMFGLCPCERCTADVKALTLTNLQPAYIVVPRSEAQGMLTVYESRFNSTVFAQLTRACKVVMDHPRHNRKYLM